MENIAGSPVEGPNFFGRTQDVDRLSRTVPTHDVLLLGPRRIGKTSIARAVMAALSENGWQTYEVNVASCLDERGFLNKLFAAVAPKTTTRVGKTKDAIASQWHALSAKVKKVSIPIPGAGSASVELTSGTEDWIEVANASLTLLASTDADADAQALIYIDELPIFLLNTIKNDPQHGVARVRRFLDWFRNDVKDLPGADQVHWLISGSVGMDTLVQQHGMADTINSMKHEGLEAFSEAQATALLNELSQSYAMAIAPDDCQRIIGAVQWPQPYYLQKVFHHLRDECETQTNADLTTAIDSAVARLLKPGEDNDFHHWEQRLTLELSTSDAGHAHALLTQSARDPSGVRPETLLSLLEERMAGQPAETTRRHFTRLRDILLRDAYWMADESAGHKRYRFRLEPLRRWWLARDTL